MTARTSSIRSSRVGRSAAGRRSDRPVPRLSKTMTRRERGEALQDPYHRRMGPLVFDVPERPDGQHQVQLTLAERPDRRCGRRRFGCRSFRGPSLVELCGVLRFVRRWGGGDGRCDHSYSRRPGWRLARIGTSRRLGVRWANMAATRLAVPGMATGWPLAQRRRCRSWPPPRAVSHMKLGQRRLGVLLGEAGGLAEAGVDRAGAQARWR